MTTKVKATGQYFIGGWPFMLGVKALRSCLSIFQVTITFSVSSLITILRCRYLGYYATLSGPNNVCVGD